MKIVSWNVNGLRASLRSTANQNLKEFLDRLGADIICFQETKATRDQLDEPLYLVDGYNAYFSFSQTRKGYSGVVTFCHNSVTPVAAEEGLTGILSSSTDSIIQCYGDHTQFTDDELMLLDSEGRAVLTEHCLAEPAVPGLEDEAEGGVRKNRLVVVNVYCPMYDPARDKEGDTLSRLQYKINFYRLLETRCSALERAGKVVLAVGDLNSSREAIDNAYVLDNPSLNNEDSPSRDWIQHFVVTSPPPSPSSMCTLVDTYRYLHPTQKGAYTCWSTLLDTRKTNHGTRIDYILASHCLAGRLTKAEVWQQIKGSDHCPVFAEFDVNLIRSSDQHLPPLCSYWFTGKQSKLLDFMTRGVDKAQKRGGVGESEARGVKRTGVQSKSDVCPPPKKSICQKTLFSFSTTSPLTDRSDSASTSTTHVQSASLQGCGGLSGAWKAVFGGPPKAPLCSGHSEACVLRKVKKQGPNKDRQFWVCSRPGGGKEDPQAKCDFFKWAKEKKK